MTVTPLVFTLDDGSTYSTTRYEFRLERRRRDHEAVRAPGSDDWFLVGHDWVRPAPVEYIVHIRPSGLAEAEDELETLRDAAERCVKVTWGDLSRDILSLASIRVHAGMLGYRVRLAFWPGTSEYAQQEVVTFSGATATFDGRSATYT